MAKNENAATDQVIEILFEVAGGGDINGKSGKAIQDDLQKIMDSLQKSGMFKLKFQIDKKSFEAQFKGLAKQAINLNNLVGGKSGKGRAGSGEAEGQEEVNNAYKQGEKIIKDYFSLQQRNYKNQRNGVTISKTLADAYKQASKEYAEWYEGFKEGGGLEEDEKAKLQALIDTQEREYKILQEKGADQQAQKYNRLADSYEKNRAKLAGLLDQRKGLRNLNKETKEWFDHMWEIANTPMNFANFRKGIEAVDKLVEESDKDFSQLRADVYKLYNEGVTEEGINNLENKYSPAAAMRESLSKNFIGTVFTDAADQVQPLISEGQQLNTLFEKMRDLTSGVADVSYYTSIREAASDVIEKNFIAKDMFNELDEIMKNPHPAVARIQEVIDKYSSLEEVQDFFDKATEQAYKGNFLGDPQAVDDFAAQYSKLMSITPDLQFFIKELKELSEVGTYDSEAIEETVSRYKKSYEGIEVIVKSMKQLREGRVVGQEGERIFTQREADELEARFQKLGLSSDEVKAKLAAFQDQVGRRIDTQEFQNLISETEKLFSGSQRWDDLLATLDSAISVDLNQITQTISSKSGLRESSEEINQLFMSLEQALSEGATDKIPQIIAQYEKAFHGMEDTLSTASRSAMGAVFGSLNKSISVNMDTIYKTIANSEGIRGTDDFVDAFMRKLESSSVLKIPGIITEAKDFIEKTGKTVNIKGYEPYADVAKIFGDLQAGNNLKADQRIFTEGDFRLIEEQYDKLGIKSDVVKAKIEGLKSLFGEPVSGEIFQSAIVDFDQFLQSGNNIQEMITTLTESVEGLSTKGEILDSKAVHKNERDCDRLDKKIAKIQARIDKSNDNHPEQYRSVVSDATVVGASNLTYNNGRELVQTKKYRRWSSQRDSLDTQLAELTAERESLTEALKSSETKATSKDTITEIINSAQFKTLVSNFPQLQDVANQLQEAIASGVEINSDQVTGLLTKFNDEIIKTGSLTAQEIEDLLAPINKINNVFSLVDYTRFEEQTKLLGQDTDYLKAKFDDLYTKLKEPLYSSNIDDYIKGLENDLSGMGEANNFFEKIQQSSLKELNSKKNLKAFASDEQFGGLINTNGVVKAFYDELVKTQKEGGLKTEESVNAIIEKYRDLFTQIQQLQKELTQLRETKISSNNARNSQLFTLDDFKWVEAQCDKLGERTDFLKGKLEELRVAVGESLSSEGLTNYIESLEKSLGDPEQVNKFFEKIQSMSSKQLNSKNGLSNLASNDQFGDLINNNEVVKQFYDELVKVQQEGGLKSKQAVEDIINKYRDLFSQIGELKDRLSNLQENAKTANFDAKDFLTIKDQLEKLGYTSEDTRKLLAQLEDQVGHPLSGDGFREPANKLAVLLREGGQYENLYNKLKSMSEQPFDPKALDSLEEEFSLLIKLDPRIQSMFEKLKASFAVPIDVKAFDEVYEAFKKTENYSEDLAPKFNQIRTMFANGEISFSSLDTLVEKFEQVGIQGTEAAQIAAIFRSEFAKSQDLSGIEGALQGLKDINVEASRVTAELSAETDTFFNKIKNAFGTNLVQKMSSMVMMTLTKSVKQIYTNIKDLDSALAQLRIVTKDASVSSQEFANTISDVAIKTATSVSSMVESVTTYARLGYSLNEATQLAELTAEYSKVAAVDVSDATTNITGIIKAFDISVSQLEDVLDKMITVGNNFAISSAELGEGLNNAAAALSANGNSLEESLGILAAANSTIQDVSRSSTAVRTVAARISNSTSELEELGEDTTDLISTAALADEMEAFGVQIVNANGELLSTYDILSQVAAQWDSYSNTAQASIAKLLAGTRQQAVFYSMIQNWDDAEAAVEACGDAGGELADSYAIYTDTIEGKINQLSASWEKFSDNILNSEGIKFLVDIVRGLLSALNFLAPALKKMGTVFVALFALIAEAIAKSITKPASEAKNEIKQLNAEMNQLEAKGKKKGGGLGSMFTSFGSAFKVFKGQAKETEQTAKDLQKTTVNTSTGGLTGSPMSNSDSANMAENQKKTAAASAESAESMSKMYNSVLMVTSITSTLLDSIFSAADVTEHWGDLISSMIPLLGAIVVLVNLIKNGFNATGVIALIAMLAMAVTSLVSAITNWETQDQIRMKKLKEELEDNISLLEEYEDKLEDINDEYEELIERVEDLQKKSANGTMTAAEADELKNTKERLGLLEQEKEISEKTVARQQEITADTANKYVEGLNSTTYSYKKATGLKKKNSDFMTSMKAIGQAGNHTTTEWISLMAQYYDLLNSEERDWLAEQIDELETYTDALDPTDEAYSEIRKVLDQYTLAISDTGWEKTFSNIIERDEFSDAKNYIYTIGTLNTELENETAKMEETLKDMSESEIDEYIEKYAAKMGIVGDDLEQLTNDVKHAQSVLQGLTEEQMQTAADALGMDVADFAEEMCDLTVEQIQIVANALDMSIEALQEIINGLTEDMIDTCGDVLGYDITSLEETIEEATSDLENNAAMQDLISYLQDVGLLGNMDQSYLEWQRETLEEEARKALDAEVAQYLAEGSKSVGGYEYQLNGYNTANAGAALDKFLKSEGYDTSTYKKFTDAYNEYATEYVNNLLAEFDELYTEDMSMMDYLINTILSYGNSYEATIYTQSYASMLADADDAFDKISSALDDINDSGIVSSSTIQDLLEDYKDLVDEYFEFTEEGYKLKDAWADMSSLEILEDYAKGQIESYIDVAVEAQDALDKAKELRNQLDEVGEAYNEEGELITKYDKETGQLTQEYLDALEAVYIAELDVENAGTNIERIAAAMATEIREAALDEMTDELQAQADALEDQLDAYQDLIDLRKELLQSYKDEIDYQKELASKTSNVADLETQLAIAKLDNSAAGQARQRELQSQLDSAQEELDDYTLENAVDRVTNQLEKEEDEFERIIDKQTEDLEDKMDEIAKNLKVTINYLYGEEDEDGNRPIIGIDSITTSYHHGGFVGGEVRDNEEFAKLLKGEFVATPAMMQNFMDDTLPGIAQAAEDGAGKGGNVFNSPLISLTCEGITTEAVPDVEKIVKKATEEIKKQFDAGFSRAGRNTRSLNLSL